jgi:deazaflavin-dependent oxidoreductase (nitroreductase family)
LSIQDPRAAMVAYNQTLINDFREHDGKSTIGHFVGRQLMLLTTIGAKTGATRVSPLAYTVDDGRVVIVASKGGADTHPAWFLNIEANPIVTVEVGTERYQARAHVALGSERERLYAQHADLHPSFHDYPKKTDRVIPVIVLERLPDEATSQG